MFERDTWECFRHPLIRGAIAVAVFVTVSCLLIPPGWAVSVPLPGKYVIDLGDASSWVIAVVAALGFWKSFKAEQKAAIAVTKIDKVQAQTDGILTEVRKASEAKGNLAGRKEQRSEDKEVGSDAAVARSVITSAATDARSVITSAATDARSVVAAAAAAAGGVRALNVPSGISGTTGPTGATGGK